MSIGKTRLEYRVVRHLGQWRIEYDRQHFGPYASQQEAVRYAIEAAHKAGQRGAAAQVLVQGRNGSFVAEWTYGQDPYPPNR